MKTSAFSRFVDVEPEKEKELLDEFEWRLENLEKDENALDHPAQLDEIYEQLAPYFEEFLRGYRVHVKAFPKEAIFIIDFDKLSREEKILLKTRLEQGYQAAFTAVYQRFVMSEKYDPERMLEFFHILGHEMFHGAEFRSVERNFPEDSELKLFNNEKETEIGFSYRRMGLKIPVWENEEKKLLYFYDLEEAIIEEMAIRFDNQYYKKIPELSFQYHERESYRKKAKKDFSFLRFKEGKVDGSEGFMTSGAYFGERKRLYNLVSELYQRNKKDFASEEDVFQLFVDANFKGSLLPLARLIEKTYGKGSFRKLGEETAKPYKSLDK